MINAVKSNSEEIHGRSEKIKLRERAEPDLMAANEDSKYDDESIPGKAATFKTPSLRLSGSRANVTLLSLLHN